MDNAAFISALNKLVDNSDTVAKNSEGVTSTLLEKIEAMVSVEPLKKVVDTLDTKVGELNTKTSKSEGLLEKMEEHLGNVSSLIRTTNTISTTQNKLLKKFDTGKRRLGGDTSDADGGKRPNIFDRWVDKPRGGGGGLTAMGLGGIGAAGYMMHKLNKNKLPLGLLALAFMNQEAFKRSIVEGLGTVPGGLWESAKKGMGWLGNKAWENPGTTAMGLGGVAAVGRYANPLHPIRSAQNLVRDPYRLGRGVWRGGAWAARGMGMGGSAAVPVATSAASAELGMTQAEIMAQRAATARAPGLPKIPDPVKKKAEKAFVKTAASAIKKGASKSMARRAATWAASRIVMIVSSGPGAAITATLTIGEVIYLLAPFVFDWWYDPEIQSALEKQNELYKNLYLAQDPEYHKYWTLPSDIRAGKIETWKVKDEQGKWISREKFEELHPAEEIPRFIHADLKKRLRNKEGFRKKIAEGLGGSHMVAQHGKARTVDKILKASDGMQFVGHKWTHEELFHSGTPQQLINYYNHVILPRAAGKKGDTARKAANWKGEIQTGKQFLGSKYDATPSMETLIDPDTKKQLQESAARVKLIQDKRKFQHGGFIGLETSGYGPGLQGANQRAADWKMLLDAGKVNAAEAAQATINYNIPGKIGEEVANQTLFMLQNDPRLTELQNRNWRANEKPNIIIINDAKDPRLWENQMSEFFKNND